MNAGVNIYSRVKFNTEFISTLSTPQRNAFVDGVSKLLKFSPVQSASEQNHSRSSGETMPIESVSPLPE